MAAELVLLFPLCSVSQRKSQMQAQIQGVGKSVPPYNEVAVESHCGGCGRYN